MINKTNVLLVGSGNMGKEYFRVIKALSMPVCVIGRGEKNASDFENETGKEVIRGGIKTGIEKTNTNVTHAILAVTPASLRESALCVIGAGIKNILLEKPGAMSGDELKEIRDFAESRGSNVFVAYNRRYYASVRRAKEIIKSDGGVSSFQFEFTEWTYKIKEAGHDDSENAILLYGNSSHVIDLAFYLGGRPGEIYSIADGRQPWYGGNSVFAGSGRTEGGAMFTYSANWNAPGRWRVEMMTQNYRLILSPLEELMIQKKGSVKINHVMIDDTIDRDYKPGLFLQTEAFLNNTLSRDGKTLDMQISDWFLYEQIEKGSGYKVVKQGESDNA